jgi:hypothetical protein
MLVANEEIVKLRREELEEKSKKCDKLESENESLKRSLEIKVWLYMCLLYSDLFFLSELSATVYRVIKNECRGFNNLSYTIHLR